MNIEKINLEVSKIIASVLNLKPEEIKPELNLKANPQFNIGHYVDIQIKLEDRFQIPIALKQLQETITLQKLSENIKNLMEPKKLQRV